MRHQLKCPELNSEAECSRILERAPWIAGYDEFAGLVPQLQGGQKQPHFAPETQALVSGHLKRNAYKRVWTVWGNNDDDNNGASARKLSSEKKKKNKRPKPPKALVAFPRVVGQVDFRKAKDHYYGGMLASMSDSQKSAFEIRVPELPDGYPITTADRLYSLGTPFLYGMLHRYLFDFAKPVKDSTRAIVTGPKSDIATNDRDYPTFTIALHSRHPNGLDGCDIGPERKCLQKMRSTGGDDDEEEAKQPTSNCRVYLLADRPCTISTLTNWITLVMKCEVVVASHVEGNGTRDEHGPFAGLGFFQDLIVASDSKQPQFPHGFVGSPDRGGLMRTSSNLLSELLEFKKRMRAWRQQQQQKEHLRNGDADASDSLTRVVEDIEDADQCLLPIPKKFLLQ